jgi:hypothetical protein
MDLDSNTSMSSLARLDIGGLHMDINHASPVVTESATDSGDEPGIIRVREAPDHECVAT